MSEQPLASETAHGYDVFVLGTKQHQAQNALLHNADGTYNETGAHWVVHPSLILGEPSYRYLVGYRYGDRANRTLFIERRIGGAWVPVEDQLAAGSLNQSPYRH